MEFEIGDQTLQLEKRIGTFQKYFEVLFITTYAWNNKESSSLHHKKAKEIFNNEGLIT